MKTYKKLIISFLAIVGFFAFALGTQAVTLNQTNISLTVGQSQTVYASNVLGNLYVSYNSSPNIATISSSGSAITIYGISNGSTTATVCDGSSSYNCSSIYVTVSSYGYNNGYNNGYNYGYNNYNTGLNISNLSLSAGSSATISSSNNYNYNNNYNNTGLYVSSNSNPNVASVSSSSLTPGCYAGNMYSIFNGQPCNGGTSYNYSSYSTSYIPGCYAGNQYSITTGQLCNSGYGGVNGANGSIVITALSAGSDTITLCQSNSNVCNTVYLTVTGYATPLSYYYNSMPLGSPYYSTPINSANPYSTTPYNYNNYNSYNTNYTQPSSISGIPVVYSTSTAN